MWLKVSCMKLNYLFLKKFTESLINLDLGFRLSKLIEIYYESLYLRYLCSFTTRNSQKVTVRRVIRRHR